MCIKYKHNWQPSNNTLEETDSDDEVDSIEMFHEECTESNSIRDEIAASLTQWLPPTETSQNLTQSTAAQHHSASNSNDIRLNFKNLRDATNVLELPEDKQV